MKDLESELIDFMNYCKRIDSTWASEFEGWIPTYIQSINSEHPVEAKTLEEHELSKKVCGGCEYLTTCNIVMNPNSNNCTKFGKKQTG